MGRILLFSEMFEVRELISQDFAAEGHMVVATGNPALIQTLLTNPDSDLVLLDLHMNMVNPRRVMQVVKNRFPGTSVLPFAVSTDLRGNLRLIIADWNEGQNIPYSDFICRINRFLNFKAFSGGRESPEQMFHREV